MQNPVNHRVFERKLRPRPSGRGHACLGVMPRVAPCATFLARSAGVGCCGCGDWPLVPCGAAGRSADCRSGRTRRVGDAYASVPRTCTRALAANAKNPCRWAPPGALGPRPQVRRGHPLSLSISISGGEETYEDSPSNGERTGKSPAWESGGCASRIVVWRSVLSDGPGPSPLERGAREGESPVRPGPCRTTRRCRRVGLFGNAAPIGR